MLYTDEQIERYFERIDIAPATVMRNEYEARITELERKLTETERILANTQQQRDEAYRQRAAAQRWEPVADGSATLTTVA